MKALTVLALLLLVLALLATAEAKKKKSKKIKAKLQTSPNLSLAISPKCRATCGLLAACVQQRNCYNSDDADGFCPTECSRTRKGGKKTPSCRKCADRVCIKQECSICQLMCNTDMSQCVRQNCTTQCFGTPDTTELRSLEIPVEGEEDSDVEVDGTEQPDVIQVEQRQGKEKGKRTKKAYFSQPCKMCRKQHCSNAGVRAVKMQLASHP